MGSFLSLPILFALFGILGLVTISWYVFEKIIPKLQHEFVAQIQKLKAAFSDNEREKIKNTFSSVVVGVDRNEKFITTESFKEYFTQNFDKNLKSNTYYRIAKSSTGIALIFTFILLGFAVYDIGSAISSSSDDVNKTEQVSKSDSEKHLQDAFKSMAAKFAVSVVGILCTIGLDIAIPRRRRDIISEIELQLGDFDESNCISAISFNIQQAQKSLTEFEKLDRLENLEVNISSLSEGLLTKLEHAMNRSIGEKLIQIAENQRSSLSEISLNLAKSVSDSVNEGMKQTIEVMNQNMKQITSKLDERSSNGVEQLIDKMQDMLSGGTKNHTAEMGNAISGFNNSIATMQSVMVGLTSSMQKFSEQASSQVNNQAEFAQKEMPLIFSKLSVALNDIQYSNQQTIVALKELIEHGQTSTTGQLEKYSTALASHSGENQVLLNRFNDLVSMSHEKSMSANRELEVSIKENAGQIKSIVTESEARITESSQRVTENIHNLSSSAAEKLTIAVKQAADALSEVSIASARSIQERGDLMAQGIDRQLAVVNERVGEIVGRVNTLQNAQQSSIDGLQNIASGIVRAQSDLSTAVRSVAELNVVVVGISKNLSDLPAHVSHTSIQVSKLLESQTGQIVSLNRELQDSKTTWDQSAMMFSDKYQKAADQIGKQFSKLVEEFQNGTQLSENISDLSDNIGSLSKIMNKAKL